MNNYFKTQYSQEDLQQRLAERRARKALSRTPSASMANQSPPQNNEDTMDIGGMMGGDSLDDIIMQNSKELQRGQSLQSGYVAQDLDRRSSMMEFGSDGDLNGFQFGNAPPIQPNLRRQSAGDLDLSDGYGHLPSGMDMASQQMTFSSGMQAPGLLSLDTNVHYGGGMSPEMMQNMQNMQSMQTMHNIQTMIDYGPLGLEGMTEDDAAAMNMYSPSSFQNPYSGTIESMANSMANAFMVPQTVPDGLLPHRNSIQEGVESENPMPMVMPGPSVTDGTLASSPQTTMISQSLASFNSPAANVPESTVTTSYTPSATPATSAPEVAPEPKPEPPPSNYQGIYSSSGFDMLGALMKVATRKDPEINIGKVDMSCAFVVCDITQYDCPIIYVSDIFERLTGYNKHEVKGQNCRFLQSPEGKVQAGSRREFVDNESVYYLRNKIADKKEAQRSLINYRKGGQPFMNLLTMIPITGEDDKEIRYFVGFQVDLVEKPTSVEGKNASGLYTVDYSQNLLPRYVWQPPTAARSHLEGGQTITREDVSTILSSINSNTESELTKRMWDKVLLENSDDVVHVLSLKGLFLYLSPSSRHVLEYDASELVGTALSSVCHPSDIVPVTRELKDTSTGVAVNVVFRIRRKKSGYTWFESHGSLCVEQGKGRKCIILVGRERPVYALHRHDIEAAGGIGESEMWIKLSTSGMVLFASSNMRNLLDRAPDEIIGTSFQALMRTESRVEFDRSLEKARTGKRVTHKHEILNRRGLVLQAQTTLYPGDASEGQKPTFLVAQTRLLKYSNSRPAAPSTHLSENPMSPLARISNDSTSISHASPPGLSQDVSSPRPSASATGPLSQAGGTGLPIGTQDVALASEDNIFVELQTTRCTSWQFELRQMEKSNRLLSEELATLISNKKKRKRRKGAGHAQRDCANCHTRVTPEWRRGPSGQRDLCNSCGLRYAKQVGRVSPRTSAKGGDSTKHSQRSTSPLQSSPLHQITSSTKSPNGPNVNNRKEKKGNAMGDDAGVSSSLGVRPSIESVSAHKPSKGLREGGERKITKIDE